MIRRAILLPCRRRDIVEMDLHPNLRQPHLRQTIRIVNIEQTGRERSKPVRIPQPERIPILRMFRIQDLIRLRQTSAGCVSVDQREIPV